MTAGLFHRHGVWVGTCREAAGKLNKKGFFEHKGIKELLIQTCGAIVGKGIECSATHTKEGTPVETAIVDAILDDGYSVGKWLWKGSAMYWKVFRNLDPIYVTARRDDESINQSSKTTGTLPQDDAVRRNAIRRHNEVLDKLEANGALRIDTPRLIKGDFEQAREVFAKCGLVLDDEITKDWVEPDLWHYTSSP